MKCPACPADLTRQITRSGILVDCCPRCGGIWLDKGEIFAFTSTPTYLKYQIEEALKKPVVSARLSPKTGQPLQTILLFDELPIEYCPKTQGFWLDKAEVSALPGIDSWKLSVQPEHETPPDRTSRRFHSLRQGTAGLPNLILSSAFTLAGLYALLTFILIILSVNFKWSANLVLFLGVAVAGTQFIFGPLLMDITLRWLYRCRWAGPGQMPAHLNAFITRVCADKKISYPRVGIIEDGSPQAFTYGHTPRNARLIISRGLIDLLEPAELDAVAAHELGHVAHWDMLVMTIAGLVPLILYYVYRTLQRSLRSSRGSGKGKGPVLVVAVVSYLLYVVSEYIVLWFSRIREYFADRFSGEVTGNPNALASALVKIGYGLAGKEPSDAKNGGKAAADRAPGMEAIRPLGIFDYRTANVMAITGYTPDMGGEIDKEKLKSAMLWDKWNPWARFFEIHSTHPLIAHRLECLTEQAVSLQQDPYIVLDRRRPESYWDEFFVDLLIKFLPLLLLLVTSFAVFPVLLNNTAKFFAVICFSFGTGYLINVLFSYSSGLDRDITIAGLLKKIKVSGVRPVACRVSGRLIGRGVPGLIFSEDFVLKDETGIIFLDYNQPLPFWNLLFGLLRAGDMIGRDITVTGWYRRAPVPFIEIRTITGPSGKTLKCHTYPAKLLLALSLMALGVFLLLFSLTG